MIVQVALSIPVTKCFSYAVPDKWGPFIKPYSRVKVPFHNRHLTGFVVGVEEKHDPGLKDIDEIADIFPLVEGALINLCEWAAYHYIVPVGMVLKYMLPAGLQPEKHLTIKTLDGRTSHLEGASLKKAYRSPGKETIFQHFSNGLIELHDLFTGRAFTPLRKTGRAKVAAQNTLFVGDIDSRLAYYVSHISKKIGEGQNVLMLLPDYYTVGRFYFKALVERFGQNVIWYGSTVNAGIRMETYFKARSGSGLLVLGNKSSVFLPVVNNGLIIVERQEEDEYRNEEGFKFNVNAIAMKRAEIEGVPAVFGSASPSMEMFRLAEDGGLAVVEGNWIKPMQYSVMRHGVGEGALPHGLIKIIEEAKERRENIAIYTPRRDYGSSVRCLTCRKPFLCQRCEGTLSYRKQGNRLVCGGCGSSIGFQETCPNCKGELTYTPYTGVEFIEERLKEIFKGSRIFSITGETLKASAKPLQQTAHDDHMILIGSQVLSKLYAARVDRLILFGWENMLKLAGYRAEEKMFQVFINLLDALRPRGLSFFMDKRMAVNPERYFDLKKFYADELKKRKAAEFPPYVRFFLIDVEKKGEAACLRALADIESALKSAGLMDHAVGPLKQKSKAGHRWKYVIKGDEGLLRKTLLPLYDISGVHIEADPLNI